MYVYNIIIIFIYKMSKPDTYNDCINILEDKKKLNHVDLKTKWEIFKDKYPRLYEMLTIGDNIDITMLKFLCDSAEKQNKLSPNEQLEHDFHIGEHLAKEFIYDKFEEPSDTRKEFIKESIRKKFNQNN